jgi:adenylate cyclase
MPLLIKAPTVSRFRLIHELFRFSPFIVVFWWTIAVLAIWHFKVLGVGTLEMQSINWRFEFRGPVKADPRIVMVGIDNASIFGDSLGDDEIEEEPDLGLLKNFPYPRKAFGIALEKIAEAGAKAVMFDVVFEKDSPLGTEEERAKDNAYFREKLLKYHDKAVIGANYQDVVTQERLKAAPTLLAMPIPELLPGEPVKDEDVVGFVNVLPDADGAIRNVWAVGWPHISQEEESIPYMASALAVKKAFPNVRLPAECEPRIIDYAGPSGTYAVVPFYHLIKKKSWDRPPINGGEIFKDKIVIIGPYANNFHDFHPTPFGMGKYGPMPGPEVHANVMATLLSEKIFHPLWDGRSYVLTTVIGLMLCYGLPLTKSALGKLVPGFIIGIAYFGFAQFSFERWNLILPYVPVLGLIIGSTSSVVIGQAIFDQLEKRRLGKMLQRYVSQNVAKELIESGEDISIPKKRFITVLFSDVRDFTSLSEQSDPGPLMQQLNEYLTEMVDCVFQHHGTLDKFIGDAVMAVFGSPKSQGKQEDAWNAVLTAIKWREKLAELNEKWQKEGRPAFRIGVGINSGEAMTGEFGSRQKVEYGAIGDSVNVASRVEGLNKGQGTDILITETVYELVADRVEVELRGDIPVKGRSKDVKVYALKSIKKVSQTKEDSSKG